MQAEAQMGGHCADWTKPFWTSCEEPWSDLHHCWAAVDCSRVFWVVLCFLFNFLPFWGWERTGQFLCQAPWLLSPAPARQEGHWDYSRCRWLCSKMHISCKKAQLGMLKTSWKTRSYTRLLHWSLCCKNKSGGVQQRELLIPQGFPNRGWQEVLCWGPCARLMCGLTALSLSTPANGDRARGRGAKKSGQHVRTRAGCAKACGSW